MTLTEQVIRELRWGTVPNVRDLGGLATPHGMTRFGRVARGPRRERFDDASWVAARGWGLRTVIDVRNDNEVGRQDSDPILTSPPDFFRLVSAPTEDHENEEFRQICFPILDSPEYWAHNVRILPELVRHTLMATADAEPGILIHCSAGRDRTGLVTALLLGIVGVDPEAIADDWAMSVRAMAGAASHSPTYDRQATWDSAATSAWLDQTRPHAVMFARDMDAHLCNIDIDEGTRQRLCDLLLA